MKENNLERLKLDFGIQFQYLRRLFRQTSCSEDSKISYNKFTIYKIMILYLLLITHYYLPRARNLAHKCSDPVCRVHFDLQEIQHVVRLYMITLNYHGKQHFYDVNIHDKRLVRFQRAVICRRCHLKMHLDFQQKICKHSIELLVMG